MQPIQLNAHFREFTGDLDTPVSVYLKLKESPSFLLESVTGGEHIARYSFIGFDPLWTYTFENGKSVVSDPQLQTLLKHHPIDDLQRLIQNYTLKASDDFPSLVGGAVGFFSWEIIEYIESITLSQHSDVPVAHYIFPKSLVIFDHAKRSMVLVTLSQDQNIAEVEKRLDDIEAKLHKPLQASPIPLHQQTPENILDHVKTNMTPEQYCNRVEEGKKHIFEGDVFQLVLSQRFETPQTKTPFDVYRNLRLINPSPYMFFMDVGHFQLSGSSPEILVKVNQKKAIVRPIAGTRPRIKGLEKKVIDDLLADEKEKSEHIMLVDLGRNDLGRVCDYDTIEVNPLMEIEAYSHVYHMVSQVEGQLSDGKTAFDVFKATFPAGTLSGAPKIRAIEIIDELEPTPRGLYGGALGYFDVRGNMDLCIIIRTVFARNKQFSIQAGAGIVADSDPKTEYQESLNKAKGMLLSLL